MCPTSSDGRVGTKREYCVSLTGLWTLTLVATMHMRLCSDNLTDVGNQPNRILATTITLQSNFKLRYFLPG